jgi:dihydroorotate dehydrogenase
MRITALPFYEVFLKPILFSLDPELVHEMALATLARLSRIPWLLNVLSRSGDDRLNREIFGLRFPNPIGLAAGFDKNGMALPAWEALGFGFVEIGSRRKARLGIRVRGFSESERWKP